MLTPVNAMESLTLPEDVKAQLERFEGAVSSVESGLAPILALDRRELEAALTPVERARVHVSMANTVSTMFSSTSTCPMVFRYSSTVTATRPKSRINPSHE